ncbi:MAG TPA: FeoC-like transcriptional regulator [Anaerolineales bacterium]|nr:FeoC-like transcriptional regulator [Anaerolineales bacterium]
MLQLLMAEIERGGTLETGNLAVRLGTTPQMVAAMLEHLRRLGMVLSYVNCVDDCGGCSLRDGCRSKADMRLWKSVPGA